MATNMSIATFPFDGAQDLRLEILRRAPLFSGLDDTALMAVADRMDSVMVEGGKPLFSAGDPGDSLYVVASGYLAVFDPPGPDGIPRIIAEIPAGDIVGELALIGHRRRSHTVAAIRDSEAFRLSRADFERLISAHPEALVGLVHKLVERYGSPPRLVKRPPRTIALIPHGPGAPCERFAKELSEAFCRLHGGPKVEIIGPEAAGAPLDRLQRAEAEATFVVYRADPTESDWTHRCLRQADLMLVVAAAGPPPEEPQLIDRLDRSGALREGPYRPRRELVLVREKPLIRPGTTSPWLGHNDYALHHHVRLGSTQEFDRLARVVVNRAIGIVMAGGGARGFAHIGVVRALREAGVPIDMAGGSSMGAIVAAATAAGWDYREMNARFHRAFVQKNPLGDYTVPFVSLYAGKRVDSLLHLAFGSVDIEDLPAPFYCVTANLTLQGRDVQRRGPLAHWLRASVSIPGVLPPVVHRGEVHVDGGVIDNFPVSPMRAMGRGPVIGIDIDTGGAMSAGESVGDSWSASEFIRRLVWKRGETLPIPSIVRIMLRSALIGSTERSLLDRERVDLLVTPPMIDFDLLDWTGFERAVEIGYRHTQSMLDKIEGGQLTDRLLAA
ncbi:MAG: cyclic nucleotide-binding domain-containing protein [Alphaproteobacteria bacterium]|nr:cyclic nucleotide-binding domain-containing protein [Alphaproteobacteria bacterium]